MSEETKGQAAEEKTQQGDAGSQGGVSAEVAELIAEAKKYRKRAQAAESELAKIREEAERRAKEEAEKKGEYEQLYQQTKAEYEAMKAQVEAYEKATAEALEVELAAVPEEMHDLIPEPSPVDKLRWIRQAKDKGLFGNKTTPPGAKPPGEGGSEVRCKADLKTAAEKAAYIKEHGGKAYLALPDSIQ